MIELLPDKEQYNEKKPAAAAEKSGFEPVRHPAIKDLRFFVKGSLALAAKFINDLDWFLAEIKSRNKG